MMATVFDLIRKAGNCIMLRATPEDIAREREELSKWFEQRWNEIPRQYALARAIIRTEDDTRRFGRRAGNVLAKHANAALLKKAEPADQCKAREIAARLQFEHGTNAGFQALISQATEMAKVLTEDRERSAELDRLEKRSDFYRFAVDPIPPPQGAA